MNIFATSSDPRLSALWLDDLRANKMILETAQLLSTAVRMNNDDAPAELYKINHLNHPCSKWARASRGNYLWLIDHIQALGQRKPSHKSLFLLPIFKDFSTKGWFPDDPSTDFRNCTTYKDETNTELAYRLYMCDKWNNDLRPPTWSTGKQPEWRT